MKRSRSSFLLREQRVSPSRPTPHIVLSVLGCLFLYGTRAYTQTIDTKAIYEKASDAVVLLLAEASREPDAIRQGTGVIVSEDGRILSALHVIKGATRVTVKLKNGDVYDDVRVIAFDQRRDLVVLKVAGFGLHRVTLGNSDDVKIGEPVALISNPEGLEQSISQGIISGVRTLEDRGYKVLQTTAPASHGSSGGAILNAKGELVAITSSKLEGGENLNFGIPINYARGMFAGADSLTLTEFAQRVDTVARTLSTSPSSQRGTEERTDPSKEGNQWLPDSELHKLEFRCWLYERHEFTCQLYNASDWMIKGARFLIVVKDKHGKEELRRTYDYGSIQGVAPRTSSQLGSGIELGFYVSGRESWQFTPTGAFGTQH